MSVYSPHSRRGIRTSPFRRLAMASNPILKLTMRQGPRTDQSFELLKDVHTIGREAGNDIIINDPQVSRHHARLTLQGNAYILEDLGSTNGSFVNGRRVRGPGG